MNQEPGPEHDPVGRRGSPRPPPGRPAGRPASRRDRRCTCRRWSAHLDLAADRGRRASGSAGSSAAHLGRDVQRRQRHRQHPAAGRRAAGRPSRGRRRGRRAAPTARRSAGCRPRGRAARPRRRTGAGAPAPRCWPQSSSPHSAASAIRRSPGGRTPNSPRSRPDEPPSSATVTTAVRSSTSGRTAAQRRQRRGQPVPAAEGDDRGSVAGACGHVTPGPGRGGWRWRRSPRVAQPARRSPRSSRRCGACRRCSRRRRS